MGATRGSIRISRRSRPRWVTSYRRSPAPDRHSWKCRIRPNWRWASDRSKSIGFVMLLWLYNLLLLPILLPYLAWRLLVRGKSREGLAERFGRVPDLGPPP